MRIGVGFPTVTITGSDAALAPFRPTATTVYVADPPRSGAGSVNVAVVNPIAAIAGFGRSDVVRRTR